MPPSKVLQPLAGHYPGRAPIDAYGNGGFRFAGMSHRGSLIALPSGVWAWDMPTSGAITLVGLERVLSEPRSGFEHLLLGTGSSQAFPNNDVLRSLASAGITVDVMTTGAACRTYNILLSEQRPVGAALICV
ncbi:MAG: hypothetical protein K2Y05_06775, partial [Hyphomicrobiaceae bacterium]|nr:hypothetical protein [Hyphomicrobiaceae bacterium]